MKNETQVHRYNKLRKFIDTQFKEEINIEKVEEICHYSYRNINRIFHALKHETIGTYIKRLRLEKGAEYLKYSNASVSDIAFEVGFGNVAAFSKAFKKKFNCSASTFRYSNNLIQDITRQVLSPKQTIERQKIDFEIEYLPDFEIIYLEYNGGYQNIKAINSIWEQFSDYLLQKELLTDDSIFLAEILDDEEITENINCRYHVGMVLEKPLKFIPEGFFKTKKMKRQKYAKFLHKGEHEKSFATYDKIYAHWMSDINLEFADLPTLEFFLNDEQDTATEDLLTEIYIPVE